jgi:predicted anti-sigma-YlaC factor YlaD
MTLDCDQLVELVTAFLDDALDSETERAVVEHLAICDGCQLYLEQVKATVRGLGELPPGNLDEQTRTTLLAAFRDTPR